MKKKTLAAAILVSILAIQSAVTSFAVVSPSADDDEPAYLENNNSNSSSNTNTNVGTNRPAEESVVVVVNQDGVKTNGVASSTTASGSTIAVVLDTTTPSGQAITVNERGEAVVGDIAVTFAKNSAATAGLPEAVVESINAINAGTPLSQAVTVGGMDLNGYFALTGTHAVVTKDNVANVVKDVSTEINLYVPNLVENLQNVSVLYYDNATGRWLMIPVTGYNAASKTVTVTVPGSGTLSVVYKR